MGGSRAFAAFRGKVRSLGGADVEAINILPADFDRHVVRGGCSDYLVGRGEAVSHVSGDLTAWMEVSLDKGWLDIDPMNIATRTALILVARGRHTARMPLAQTFGVNTLYRVRVLDARS